LTATLFAVHLHVSLSTEIVWCEERENYFSVKSMLNRTQTLSAYTVTDEVKNA